MYDKRELAGGGSTRHPRPLKHKRSPSLGGGGPIRVGGPLWLNLWLPRPALCLALALSRLCRLQLCTLCRLRELSGAHEHFLIYCSILYYGDAHLTRTRAIKHRSRDQISHITKLYEVHLEIAFW